MRALLRRILFMFMLFGFSSMVFADDAMSNSASSAMPPTTVATTQAININTADTQTLIDAHLKGIGAKRAADIVAYRQQHGPFKSIDDLKNIKGIGQKYIDANRDKLTIG